MGTSDCLLVLHKALEMGLVLQITERIGVVLTREMSLSLFVMGLSGKPQAIRSTQKSLMARL